MDLVDYSEERFQEIVGQIEALKEELSLVNVEIIPVSATEGDNVTQVSSNIPWYHGEALLSFLEHVDMKGDVSEEGFYMPVQRVCRPNHEFRGFQGQIEAGAIHVGDEITTLPSNEKAHVKSIHILNHATESAGEGHPVTIQLDREVDVSRGCVLMKEAGLRAVDAVEATLLWMDDIPLETGKNFYVKLGTKLIPGNVTRIVYNIDVNSGEKKAVDSIRKNEIAVCQIRFTDEIVSDLFARHKTLGELILIDRVTNMTSACGVVMQLSKDAESDGHRKVNRESRSADKGQRAVTVEFVAGKAGIDRSFVERVERELNNEGRHTYLYAPEDSSVAAEVVKHLNEAGIVVLLYVEKDFDTGIFAEDRTYYGNWNTGETLSVPEAVKYVRRRSQYTTEVEGQRAYI